MKHLIIVLTLALIAIFSIPAQADVTTKVCEDRDKDGRFGVVKYTLRQAAPKPGLVQANIGTYNSCLTRIRQLSTCKNNALCTCEDWNRDGRFGVVKNKFKKRSSRVVRPNISNYYACVNTKNSMAAAKDTAGRYHACEDRDRDGRFGLVRYLLQERLGRSVVIAANHGNYYSCTNHKATLNQCKGNRLCTCEDRDKDGRFGVVKYPGKRISGQILNANVGTYNQCLSRL